LFKHHLGGIHTITPPGKLARGGTFLPLRKKKEETMVVGDLDGSLIISYKDKV
jgi:hypothetical protein